MNDKWHINSKGIPAVCKASKKACPLGTHYDSEEEAFVAIEQEYEKDYELLPKNNYYNLSDENVVRKKNFAELIQRISGIKSNGFDYECYASISIAEELGLDKVAITDDNGLIVNINIGTSTEKNINADVYVKKSIEGLYEYYSKLGLPIKDKNLLARVVYYSEDDNKSVLVQSGGPNVLDAAIIKVNGEVDIIEVKELERGAQLPLISIDVDEDGNMDEEMLKSQDPYIQEALKGVRIQDIDGNNLNLDFGSENANRKAPLYHFVKEYKKKGATSFIYTTEKGAKVNQVDLRGPEDQVVQDLIDKGIEAKIVLRGNLSKQNANEKDIARFNDILSKEYFKSGRKSDTESFTLKAIKTEKISKSGEYVRVGGYVLPIKYEDYKDNLNKRIKKTDLKAFKFSLTGNIKTNY